MADQVVPYAFIHIIHSPSGSQRDKVYPTMIAWEVFFFEVFSLCSLGSTQNCGGNEKLQLPWCIAHI